MYCYFKKLRSFLKIAQVIIIILMMIIIIIILFHAGKVRLMNGLSPNEGRLEIYRHGTWYTVYYYDFSQNDATVVCRQLGFLT